MLRPLLNQGEEWRASVRSKDMGNKTIQRHRLHYHKSGRRWWFMPWKVMLPMEQRTQMLLDLQSGVFGKADLSRKHGVSRKTSLQVVVPLRIWWNWFSLSWSLPSAVQKSQCHFRSIGWYHSWKKRKNKSCDPKKIHVQLQTSYLKIALPSVGTIGNVLKRKGLVVLYKRR